VLLVYIFVTTHTSSNILMRLQLQATVHIHHAALPPLPRPPSGPAFLASPLCHLLHLNSTNLQRLAHITPLDEPGADNDADDDVKYWLVPPG
jgi:hypothetical protein